MICWLWTLANTAGLDAPYFGNGWKEEEHGQKRLFQVRVILTSGQEGSPKWRDCKNTKGQEIHGKSGFHLKKMVIKKIRLRTRLDLCSLQLQFTVKIYIIYYLLVLHLQAWASKNLIVSLTVHAFLTRGSLDSTLTHIKSVASSTYPSFNDVPPLSRQAAHTR